MTTIAGALPARPTLLETIAHRLANGAWGHLAWLQGVLDCTAWAGGFLLAWLVLDRDPVNASRILVLIAAATVLQAAVGWILHLYRQRYLYGSFSDLGVMGASALLIGLTMVLFAFDRPEIAVFASLAAVVTMAGTRYLIRLGHDSALRPRTGEPVIVVGAGHAGRSLITQMLADPDSAYLPVGILDDDHSKQHLRIEGVPVIGRTEDLPEIAQRVGAAGVIVAIAGIDATFLRDCRDRLDGTGIWLRTIPSLTELVSRKVELGDIRSLNVEDLIGRSPISIDMCELTKTVRGRRVLVTGAGGSIGSELCRQLWALEPEELIMLDRDETALHSVELSIMGSALLTASNTVLADIRDEESLHRIFEQVRPQIVFHAAALKHLPMLERFPLEGWKTNVHGTLNVLQAARAAGVETFVNISTDKAAAPVSELGRSKRLGERLVAGFGSGAEGTYLSVRFGNVLGSRGSVLLAFQEQLRSGRPLTVTDPDVTRYFMTIPEACQLVLQAAAIGDPGSVMVLDMGEPVKIVDIARNLIRMSDCEAEIVFTGLRPGEKLEEELFGDYESAGVQVHDKISQVSVPRLEKEALPRPDAPAQVVQDFVLGACAPVPVEAVRKTGDEHAA